MVYTQFWTKPFWPLGVSSSADLGPEAVQVLSERGLHWFAMAATWGTKIAMRGQKQNLRSRQIASDSHTSQWCHNGVTMEWCSSFVSKVSSAASAPFASISFHRDFQHAFQVERLATEVKSQDPVKPFEVVLADFWQSNKQLVLVSGALMGPIQASSWSLNVAAICILGTLASNNWMVNNSPLKYRTVI